MDFQTRYEFNPKTDLLGKGGFSKVYKASDTLLDRTVALKFFTASASEKYQVLSEIKKVIQFEHPNLCKYYDVAVLNSTNIFGEVEKTEIGIMEYLDAGDLKTYINNHPQSIDKLLIDVLKGLSYLHKKGIVHRDLKPQNILVKIVDDEPVAKITDFGISKLISSEDNNSSALMGTIEYMAPEQFNPKKYGLGGRIGTNLDLWSFGLLVYEAVHHKSLFGRRSDGTSAEQVMRNILSDFWLTKINSLPEKYRLIVKKCLVKNASDRVQNAYELIPLFSGNEIHADKIFVGTSEEQEDDRLNYEPEFYEPEQEDMDEDTALTEPADTSTGTTLLKHPQEDERPLVNTEMSPPDPEETNNDDTQVIEPGPVTDDTQDHHPFEETSIEYTEQLPPAQKNIDSEDTQIIQPEQGVTGEYTEVLEFPEEVPGEEGNVNNRPGKEESAPSLINNTNPPLIQPAEPEIKAVTLKKKSLAKMVLLSVALVLVITSFFLIRFLSEDKPKVDATKIPENTITQPAEQPPLMVLPELVQVNGGSFLMGNKNSTATNYEKPAHLVHLNNFSIGKYEVTVDQFRQFVSDSKYTTTAEEEDTSDIYKNGDWQAAKSINWRHDMSGRLLDTNIKNIPVVHVSWTDVNRYCEWLSKKMNKPYRLPTEAEWEFAAKGGNNSKNFRYSGSNDIEDVAWYLTNSQEKIHAIGQKQPNELGIYDMSGNVMEWCNDWFDKDYYKKSTVNNPDGPATGYARVVRGGGFLLDTIWFRNSFRDGLSPDVRGGQLGFRICKSEATDSTGNTTLQH